MRVAVNRSSIFTACLLAVAAAIPHVATAQTVDEIVAKHIEARGGAERLKAIQTVRITRTFATPFSNVAVVTFKKRPDLLRIEQTPRGQTTASVRGINKDGAWDVVQGKVVMRPARVTDEGRETDGDFDGLLVDWKEKGHTIALEGRESFAGSEAFKLKVTTKSGSVRYLFIDTKSYLETGMSGRVLTPAVDPRTKEHRFYESVWTFSDYRDVNGVKFPFSIDEERVNGPITQSFAIYTDKIEVNVPMDDGLFAPPSGAK